MPIDPTDIPEYIPPDEFDVTLPDITNETFKDVAEELAIDPKWKTKRVHEWEKIKFPVYGTIYGRNLRPFIPLVVETMKKEDPENRKVIFLINTASPYTFLTKDVFAALGYDERNGGANLRIHGQPLWVEPSHSHFAHVNILGGDYLRAIENMQVNLYYRTRAVSIGPKLFRFVDCPYDSRVW